MLLILQLPRRDLGFDLLKMPKIRIVLQTAMKTKCRHIVSMRSKNEDIFVSYAGSLGNHFRYFRATWNSNVIQTDYQNSGIVILQSNSAGELRIRGTDLIAVFLDIIVKKA